MYVGGGGIPALACHPCQARNQRGEQLAKAQRWLGIAVLAALVVGALLSPYAFIVGALVAVGWGVLSWQRIRAGMGTPWDYLRLAAVFRRLLP